MSLLVDRTLPTSLTDQLLAGLRAAIESGVYGDGQMLPSIRELAAELGVSLIVVRNAYARLHRSGLVEPRHGRGFVAVGKRSRVWKGRVLIVGLGSGENYLSYSASDVLVRNLTRERYLVSCVNVPGGADRLRDDSVLGFALRQQYDLVISLSDDPQTAKRLAKLSCPVVVLYNEHVPVGPNVTAVRFRDDAAVPALVAHCRALGVRRVTQVAINPHFADARKALSAAGVRVDLLQVKSGYGRDNIEAVMTRVQRFFAAKLARGRAWLPDLIYFSDDYLATAAVGALLKAGVRIPEDVRLVSWSNAGLGPVVPVPCARIRFDGYAAGERLHRLAQELLAGKNPPDAEIATGFTDA